MSSPDPDFAGALQEFKRGGWLVALLGGGGALVRWILHDEDSSWSRMVKCCISGSIVGVISFFALYGQDIPEIYKSIIMTTSGAMSHEMLAFLSKKVKTKNK